jgi:hypothetical protein
MMTEKGCGETMCWYSHNIDPAGRDVARLVCSVIGSLYGQALASTHPNSEAKIYARTQRCRSRISYALGRLRPTFPLRANYRTSSSTYPARKTTAQNCSTSSSKNAGAAPIGLTRRNYLLDTLSKTTATYMPPRFGNFRSHCSMGHRKRGMR